MSKKFWGGGKSGTKLGSPSGTFTEKQDILDRQAAGQNPLTEDQQAQVQSRVGSRGFKFGLGSAFAEGNPRFRRNSEGTSTLNANIEKLSEVPTFDVSANSAYRQQMALRKVKQTGKLS